MPCNQFLFDYEYNTNTFRVAECHAKYIRIQRVENFKYDHSSDTYTCPAHQTLTTNQKWYKTPNYRFKQYKTKACEGCSLRIT